MDGNSTMLYLCSMARDDVQVNFRMPEALKTALEEAARANKRSVTAELVSRLEASFSTELRATAFPSEKFQPGTKEHEEALRVADLLFAAIHEFMDTAVDVRTGKPREKDAREEAARRYLDEALKPSPADAPASEPPPSFIRMEPGELKTEPAKRLPSVITKRPRKLGLD